MAQQNNLAKGIISIIVILIAVFLMLNMKFHWIPLGFLGGKPSPADPVVRKVVTIDMGMDPPVMRMAILNEKKGEKFPLRNPDTGLSTLFQAYVCREEKIIFPIKGMAMFCPFCAEKGINNMNVGAATEEEAGYEVKIPRGMTP